jgi:hypothetical protein
MIETEKLLHKLPVDEAQKMGQVGEAIGCVLEPRAILPLPDRSQYEKAMLM